MNDIILTIPERDNQATPTKTSPHSYINITSIIATILLIKNIQYVIHQSHLHPELLTPCWSRSVCARHGGHGNADTDRAKTALRGYSYKSPAAEKTDFTCCIPHKTIVIIVPRELVFF